MNTNLSNGQDWLELAEKANWSPRKLATICNVSLRTLERFFLKNHRKTPKAWLVEQRQKRAVMLLKRGLAVKETAALLNYRHPNQFSREFSIFWGHSPCQKSSRP
jgi:AraC-like DNA-binding protein